MPYDAITRHFLLTLIIMSLAAAGCDDDTSEEEPDGGDTEDAGMDAGPARSCISCHLDRDMLEASLEADPLPEEDTDEESTGEG